MTRRLSVSGFAKSRRGNISTEELKGFKKLASVALSYDEFEIAGLVETGALTGLTVMKKMKKQYKSDILAAIHETAEGFHAAGVMPRRTMREFDQLCLTPVRPLTADEIRSLRLREAASQAVFARHLNVTTGLVSQWERGEKHPRGPSLKLLTLVKEKGLSSVA